MWAAMKVSFRSKLNSDSSPIKIIEVIDPITEAINRGMKLAVLISNKMTSIAKITAPIGAPNIAEIAPAAPHPINSVRFFGLRCINRPTFEPIAEPVTTMGASKPTDPPNPTVSAEVITLL